MNLHELLSEQVGQLLKQHQLVLTTAESCTGGAIATSITAIAGSSAWFEQGFVTYSNQAKMEMLGVTAQTLATHGAISERTVESMAEGALASSKSSIAVAVSGIAGPDGGTAVKPVGTVCFAWFAKTGWKHIETMHFSGDRTQVRSQVVGYALQTLKNYLESIQC